MAAKVVMVAVPTVLGIASIRVYRVSEAPADGLITREKLSVYTPLPESPQFQFVAEKPGALQSGLTNIREGLLPYAQAVQGACVSVKNGGINLYHAGEDVYYYLKDPPPGFLPRLGTITTAGLLGMFLARRGSSFKRLAVPLGATSVAASACYPAQAVAVLKVTSKKLYAAGQWSSTTVSSLFTSTPKEPVALQLAAPQPQSDAVPKPESPVVDSPPAPCHAPETTSDSPPQTMAASETETVTEPVPSETFPVSEEAPEPVITEELSSTTHTPLPPEETTADTTTETAVESVPSESTSVSEEPPTPEPADQTAETVVESESTPASDEAPDQPPAPTQTPSPAEQAPVDTTTGTLVESVPVESVPAPEETAPPEETAAPVGSEEPLAPACESSESAGAVAESSTPVVEEPSIPTPPPEQALTETSTGGSGFQADPALMDFGQSHPEDEDLYSTRS
ncbi:MICOS complex subunit MIC27 isoform 2-T2 [Polymixia lowei]